MWHYPMHTLLLILAIHGLLFGFGFLLAGFCNLIASEEAERAQFKKDYEEARRKGFMEAWICERQFRRDFVGSERLGKNWTQRPDARKYIYVGLASLAFAAVIGIPLGAYNQRTNDAESFPVVHRVDTGG